MSQNSEDKVILPKKDETYDETAMRLAFNEVKLAQIAASEFNSIRKKVILKGFLDLFIGGGGLYCNIHPFGIHLAYSLSSAIIDAHSVGNKLVTADKYLRQGCDVEYENGVLVVKVYLKDGDSVPKTTKRIRYQTGRNTSLTGKSSFSEIGLYPDFYERYAHQKTDLLSTNYSQDLRSDQAYERASAYLPWLGGPYGSGEWTGGEVSATTSESLRQNINSMSLAPDVIYITSPKINCREGDQFRIVQSMAVLDSSVNETLNQPFVKIGSAVDSYKKIYNVYQLCEQSTYYGMSIEFGGGMVDSMFFLKGVVDITGGLFQALTNGAMMLLGIPWSNLQQPKRNETPAPMFMGSEKWHRLVKL